MSEFDILFVCLIVACLLFGVILVKLEQRIKMLRYSLRNVEAANKKLRETVNEHQECWKLVNKKLSNLGQ